MTKLRSLSLSKPHRTECEIAGLLKRLITAERAYSVDQATLTNVDKVLATTKLDTTQRAAATAFLSHPISILTGGPGTGKTTTLEATIRIALALGLRVHALCPSANAGRRIEELFLRGRSTSDAANMTIGTIHRALAWNGVTFRRSYDDPLDCDLLIIDESSMVAPGMLRGLLLSIDPHRTSIVLCGDQDQLPSIEAGAVFRDCIASGAFFTSRLETIYRQGETSGIAKNAARIRKGEVPSPRDVDGVEYRDFSSIACDSDSAMLTACLEIADRHPSESFQAMALGYRGDCGVTAMNKRIRELKNPSLGRKAFMDFCLGDRVINKRNSREANCYNGQTGTIIEIGEKGMVIQFSGRAGPKADGIVKLNNSTMGMDLHLAYTITVHSAQGSEFPNGVLAISPAHWTLLSRNSIYTGHTRFQKNVTLVYQGKALKHGLRVNATYERQTGLSSQIAKAFS